MQSVHRIQRLAFRCRADSPAAALTVRKRLADSWEQLLPLFEREFDQWAGADQHIHLPRLSLHLSVGSGEELLETFSRTLAQALRENALETSGPGRQPDADTGQLPLPPSPLLSPSPDQAQPGPAATGPTGQGYDPLWRALQHYLQTGQLLWFASSPTDVRAEFRDLCRQREQELCHWVGTELSLALLLRWLPLLAAEQREPAALALLHGLAPVDGDNWATVLRALHQGRLPTDSPLQQTFCCALLLARAANVDVARSLPGIAIPATAGLSPARWQQWQAALVETGVPPQWLVRQIAPLLDASGTLGRAAPAAEGDPAIERSSADRPPAATATDATADPDRQQAPSQRLALAGSVLLYPYLQRLFAARALTVVERSIGLETLPRAAALIYYCATGDETPLGHELDVARLLLGLPGDQDIFVAPGTLTAADKAEADVLLAALISHWSRLKNTSADGLRRAFLQRPGFLIGDGGRLHLRFDRLGQDVLLDFLPYSLSTVKLPWMPKPLYVTW